MKKYQLIFLAINLLLLSLFPSFLISQESNKGKINFGFEGGVQFTNVEDLGPMLNIFYQTCSPLD